MSEVAGPSALLLSSHEISNIAHHIIKPMPCEWEGCTVILNSWYNLTKVGRDMLSLFNIDMNTGTRLSDGCVVVLFPGDTLLNLQLQHFALINSLSGHAEGFLKCSWSEHQFTPPISFPPSFALPVFPVLISSYYPIAYSKTL
jgi:hypothetical protein